MFSLYFILFTFVLQIQKSLKKFNNHLPFIVIFQYKKEVSSNHSWIHSLFFNSFQFNFYILGDKYFFIYTILTFFRYSSNSFFLGKT